MVGQRGYFGRLAVPLTPQGEPGAQHPLPKMLPGYGHRPDGYWTLRIRPTIIEPRDKPAGGCDEGILDRRLGVHRPADDNGAAAPRTRRHRPGARGPRRGGGRRAGRDPGDRDAPRPGAARDRGGARGRRDPPRRGAGTAGRGDRRGSFWGYSGWPRRGAVRAHRRRLGVRQHERARRRGRAPVPAVETNVAGPLQRLFAENLRRYLDGQPLRNVVDRARGY